LLVLLPGCIVQVDWKLNRGKWRPRLLDYAKAAQVRRVGSSSGQQQQ
jgi:hypothetical protein